MSFEHDIPVGGYIKVQLPDAMAINNEYTLESNCYRLDYSSRPISLDCEAHTNYFYVIVTYSEFGNSYSGLLGGEQFKLQVFSINNPRGIGTEHQFSISSYDSLGRLIDESTSSDRFVTAMDTIGSLIAVDITPEGRVTGEVTEYKFTIVPNCEI